MNQSALLCIEEVYLQRSYDNRKKIDKVIFHVNFRERPPSPTRYYAKDDLIKTSQPAFSFNKEGIDDTPKLEDFDMRKPLDINLKLVKPRVPTAVILPEHKEEAGPELEDIKRGPGAYEAKYDLTEKRVDIGGLKFPELNEHNQRENQVDLAKKDVCDADLDPNYDVNKPRAPAFVYHKPVELGNFEILFIGLTV